MLDFTSSPNPCMIKVTALAHQAPERCASCLSTSYTSHRLNLMAIADGLNAAPFARFYGKKVAVMGQCEEILPAKDASPEQAN